MTMQDTSTNIPADFAEQTTYENISMPLFLLFQQHALAGKPTIEGKTFIGCHFSGPAIMLALGGVDFDGCNMGDHGGDIRNMLVKPVGPERVIGVIPFVNCKFQNCSFFAVGFTGNDDFLKLFQDMLGTSAQ